MDEWQQLFVKKLERVQDRWSERLDEVLDNVAQPVFEELSQFLRHNGFVTATPLRERGRRSFKFEMGEDVYVLVIFEVRSGGEFQLTRQVFAVGEEPQVHRSIERISAVSRKWAQDTYRHALDAFVNLLGGAEEPVEEEVAVV